MLLSSCYISRNERLCFKRVQIVLYKFLFTMVKATVLNDKIIHGPEPLEPVDERSFGIQLYEKLKEHQKSSKHAFVHAVTGETVSYKELLEISCRLAVSLRKCNVQKDTIISIYSENNLKFAYPLLSALFIGAIAAPLNPMYTLRELKHGLSIAKPKIMFCTKITLEKVLQARKEFPFERIIVLDDLDFKIVGVESLQEFLDIYSDDLSVKAFTPTEVKSEDQVALILYSSGTTGLPKGVMITHRNIAVRFAIAKDSRWLKGSSKKEVSLIYLPLFHAIGLQAVFWSIYKGRSSVIMPRFDLELFLQLIQKYKIEEIVIVPPIAVLLAKSPLVSKYDLSNLKYIFCGAAPLHKETEEELKRRLKIDSIYQGYGMTEMTLGVTYSPRNIKSGSVGTLVPFTSAKIIDPNTKEVLGPNQPGELCFKGGLIMKGYLGESEETRNAIDEEGWLHTGDIGYYDEDGYFFIVDRLKELIKVKGFQVAPAELEAILLLHPKIQDAAVIGVPDILYGEKPTAFVVRRPGQEVTEKEIIKFVAKQVSPQKRLHGVRFVETIPKNPSGKILRRELRNIVHREKSKL